MKQMLHTLVAGATGAVLATAVLVGQPALADIHAKTAAKNSVTSKSIKNATIKTKDLSAEVSEPLAKAGTALQSIPDNGVTNPKMADNAVGSTEVINDSLGGVDLAANSVAASEIQDNSVGAGELANNAVAGANVIDGSLGLADYSTRAGFAVVAVPGLAVNACANLSLDMGSATIVGGYVIVNPNVLAEQGLQVEGARVASPTDIIDFRVCNRGAGAFAANNQTFLWALLN